MLKITSIAKQKINELIELERLYLKNNRQNNSEVGIWLNYHDEVYDNRRAREGENEFFVAEKAGWKLVVIGAFNFRPEKIRLATQGRTSVDNLNTTVKEGILIYSAESFSPKALLDFDGEYFMANGEMVIVA